MRYSIRPYFVPNDNPPEYYEREIDTHWTAEQIIELAAITPEGWDEIFEGYIEWSGRQSRLYLFGKITLNQLAENKGCNYITDLLTLAQDMKAKGISREEDLKCINIE